MGVLNTLAKTGALGSMVGFGLNTSKEMIEHRNKKAREEQRHANITARRKEEDRKKAEAKAAKANPHAATKKESDSIF